MAGDEIFGKPVECDMERSEDDTDDIAFRLLSGGVAIADADGFTGTFNIGTAKDSANIFTAAGLGEVLGPSIIFDMTGFSVTPASYFWSARYTDTNIGDTPSRVFARGKIKVTERIT